MEEELSRIAATVFTDEHYGSALTEAEYERHKILLEVYKEEIEQAKKIIATDTSFNDLSYKEKVAYVVKLLNRLRVKNHGTEEIMENVPGQNKDNYADLGDLLDSIPQEPYEPIFKEDDSNRMTK